MANVITNGDFSLGTTDFNSEAYSNTFLANMFNSYSATIPDSAPPPRYWSIGTDPSLVKPIWPSFGDNTGGGNMFLALPEHTGTTGTIYAHFENITVAPNTNYTVSFYVRNIDATIPSSLLNAILYKEDSEFDILDSQWFGYVSLDDSDGWVQYQTVMNTGDASSVRLQVYLRTEEAWALDDVSMEVYEYDPDVDDSSSSSSIDDDLPPTVIVPSTTNITYFSYFNGAKEINNPIINNSTGMRFGGYLDTTNDNVKYDSFGYGLDKTTWNHGVIWCDDASTLFSMERGYVKMILNFDSDLSGGHSGLTGTPDYNEYMLWGVNVGKFDIETGGIGARFTSGSLEFEIKSAKGNFLLRDYGLNVDSGEDVTFEFVWELGGMTNSYTAMLLVDGEVRDYTEFAYTYPSNSNDFSGMPFYCLNTPLGHSNMPCTIKHLQTADGIPSEFKETLETSSSSSSSSTEGDGPAIGVNQPVIIFGFIDESSPYADPAIRSSDTDEFDDYISDYPPLSGSKFVCFCCKPPPINATECENLFPGPSSVTEDEMQKNTTSEWTKMKTYVDQAFIDMGLDTNDTFYLFFSIDNSGSMRDADVRSAINSLLSYVNWTYPNCQIDDTYGSKQERWIRDMLEAYTGLTGQ